MKIQFKGMVSQAPTLAVSKNGKEYARATIAVEVETDNGFKTGYYPIVFFETKARDFSHSIKQHDVVEIFATLQNTQRIVNGFKNYSLSLIANDFKLLNTSPVQTKSNTAPRLNDGYPEPRGPSIDNRPIQGMEDIPF